MIDWKARLTSKPFWIGVVGVVGTAVVSFGQLLGVDLTSDVNSVSEAATMVVTAVFAVAGIVGVVANPTTPGITDGKNEDEVEDSNGE